MVDTHSVPRARTMRVGFLLAAGLTLAAACGGGQSGTSVPVDARVPARSAGPTSTVGVVAATPPPTPVTTAVTAPAATAAPRVTTPRTTPSTRPPATAAPTTPPRTTATTTPASTTTKPAGGYGY